MHRHDQIAGCLLGTALGDSIGLPLENLSRRRIGLWLHDRPLGHRFLFGHGMVSDDTEHSCLVAQAIIASGEDPQAFGRDLARRLRWWLAGLPAGTGRATARACIKLWLGARYDSSGVWSAGNGPAMRSAIIGAAVDRKRLAVDMTRISARITHADPKATYGALAIAAVTYHSVRQAHLAAADRFHSDQIVEVCREWIGETDDPSRELLDLIAAAGRSVDRGETTEQFAADQGMERGVSGYTYQTVPAALHACLRSPDDFRAAIEELVRCGGDVDSTAAIAGGILGATLGPAGLPPDWLARLVEWPRSKTWMRRLARQLTETNPGDPQPPIRINPLAQFARNLLFLMIVLCHGLRRLLPPW